MTEKPTCQTCTLKPCPHFSEMVHENDTAYFIMDIIRKVGCLSHPGAREYLMKDVIEELEERIDMFSKEAAAKDNYCLSYRAAGIAEAITLIRDGVK